MTDSSSDMATECRAGPGRPATEAEAFFEEVIRRANQKGRRGSFHLRHHQALAEMYAEGILPVEPVDDARMAPRKLVEGVALAVRLGRKKDGQEPLREKLKPEKFFGRVAEAFQTPEELRGVLGERAATRAYLVHLSDGSFAAARACFHPFEDGTESQPPEPQGGPGLNTAAGEPSAWPPERIVYRITDRNVHAEGVREQLAWVPGNKVLIISRRSVEDGDIRHAVRFFEACGDGRDAALVNVGRVIVVVDGYDDDRRELWQIPRVRRFFARLWEVVPHLLFFLLPEGPPGQVGSVMFLITMLHPEPRGRGASETANGKWHMLMDWKWVATGFLEKGFAAMNAFSSRYGIHPSDAPIRSLVRRITKELMAARDDCMVYH